MRNKINIYLWYKKLLKYLKKMFSLAMLFRLLTVIIVNYYLFTYSIYKAYNNNQWNRTYLAEIFISQKES